jgi:site-specific DNA-methyltransferase (adenine-specific)
VATHSFKGAHFATFPPDLIRPCVLAGAPRGGLVLDPFGGAGTTALVAMQEGRRSVICELNPEYAALARQRLDLAWANGAAQMDMLLDQSPAA